MTLAGQAIAYCGSAPAPAELMGRWNGDPVLLMALAFSALAAGRLARDAAMRTRLLAAIGVMAVLFVSPLCAATSALFSARVLHHLVLVAAVAPLLAAAVPAERRPLLGAGAALALHAGSFWLWHVPAFYTAALSSTAGYWAMQATLLVPAVLFWHAVRRGGAAPAVFALIGAVAQMGLLGAILTFAARPLYPQHLLSTLPWGLSPIEDQQLAGLLMWVPALLPYAIAAAFVARGLMSGDQTRRSAS